MTCYVDTLSPTRITLRWPYSHAAHLIADTDEELLSMAKRLNLRRSYVQIDQRGRKHFDLTATKRRQAVKLGAVELDWREMAKRFSGHVADELEEA